MRIKNIKRYWCDHCNKAGLQLRAMIIHEKHCTMNPARECRVCKLIADIKDDESKPLAELIAMLPDPEAIKSYANYESQKSACEALQAIFPALWKAAGECPACVMAALRQAGIPVPVTIEYFDFKAEMESIFSRLNDNQREDGY